MLNRRIKYLYFVFEGLGSLACGFYSNYKFFLLRDRYGFGNLGNLGAAALQGLVFALASWQGGRFAQRHGYYTALNVGLAGMTAALLAGGLMPSLTAQMVVLVGWTAAACFVWPALEALVSEGEDQQGLPRMLGIYNVVWASCSALAYFFGGAVFDHLGAQSIFWLPSVVYVLLLGLVAWLARRHPVLPHGTRPGRTAHEGAPDLVLSCVQGPTISQMPEHRRALGQSVSPRTFLRMAWLANPFACIGLSTVLALVPGLARELRLSTTRSGFFCSIWFFARLAAFVGLWYWKGWHYRFRGLLGAFLGLLGGFALILIGRDFWTLVLGQIVFGLSVGLLYYSSLFYSMDVGETKGEYGGLHEAAMGAGNCVGPAFGAAALLLAPGIANAGAYAVSGVLVVGLAALLGLRLRQPQPIQGMKNCARQHTKV